MITLNDAIWKERHCQLRLQNVCKVYGNETQNLKAIEAVSFDVFQGELVSILGPSGSGKTTLLKLIAGFIPCTSGNILFEGQQVTRPSYNRTMIFQEHNLFPWKTVIDNIAFGLKAKGIKRKARKLIAQDYIYLVHLAGFENYYPYQLSGGMRQRVAIARSLVVNPSCILMDEPFGSLDSQLKNHMQNELLDILSTHKTTVIFVTHDIEEAIYLSDRILILSQSPGRVENIFNVPFPRPRDPDIKFSVDFQKIKSELLFNTCNRGSKND